ncbi:MAG: glycosyltransferase family 39 protein [Chloroflexota bacterium]
MTHFSNPRYRAAGALLAITLILLIAAGLRLHRLGGQSLWNDEGNSFVQATRSISDIATNAALDIHPPGYYWILGGWRLLTGTSEFALRSLSAFASLLSVAFAYTLGRRLFGWTAAITAAILIAVNTFSIYYAQEARMYALLALWSAASLWALAGFLHRPSWRCALALALFNAAGLWTQYAFPFIMIAQGIVAVVWLMLGLRRSIRPYLSALAMYILANLLTIVLYLPWIPTAIHQLTTWPNTGDGTPFPQAFNTVMNWLTFGNASPGAELAIPALLLLFGLLIAKRRTLWQVIVPVAWVVVPVGLFLALGLFRADNIKLLLPAQIGLALWIGRGVWVLWTLKPKYGRRRDFVTRFSLFVPPATAILSVIWLALIAWDGIKLLYNDPAFQRANYRAIVQTLQGHERLGDSVILDAPNQAEVFGYYYPYSGHATVYPLPQGLGGDDAATHKSIEDIISMSQRIFVVYWGDAERDPNRIVESTLDGETFELGETWYGDVRLARYETPIPLTIMHESGAAFGDHISLVNYALSAERLQSGDALQVEFHWQTDTSLSVRYKVFLQLLDANGALVAQRDSEPGGGLAITTSWTPGQPIADRHALLIDVPPGSYTLIAGLYDLNDPSARLPVNGDTYVTLATITVTGN